MVKTIIELFNLDCTFKLLDCLSKFKQKLLVLLEKIALVNSVFVLFGINEENGKHVCLIIIVSIGD